MRKFFIFFLITITLVASAQEANNAPTTGNNSQQTTRESKKGVLEFTDYVGACMSSLSVDGEHPYKNAWGVDVAFGVRYHVTDYFYTEGFVDFSNYRTYDLKDAKELGYIYANTSLYNINIPVHLGAFIPTTKNGGICLSVGPSIRFNAYGKSSLSYKDAKGKIQSYNKSMDCNTVSLGIDFGAMYNFGGAAVGINYSLGVTELSKKTKESALSIRLQYNVPIKKKK